MFASGLSWSVLGPCVRWMTPYFTLLSEETAIPSIRVLSETIQKSSGLKHTCPKLVVDESHTLQTHVTSIDMFVSTFLYFVVYIIIFFIKIMNTFLRLGYGPIATTRIYYMPNRKITCTNPLI